MYRKDNILKYPICWSFQISVMLHIIKGLDQNDCKLTLCSFWRKNQTIAELIRHKSMASR